MSANNSLVQIVQAGRLKADELAKSKSYLDAGKFAIEFLKGMDIHVCTVDWDVLQAYASFARAEVASK